MYIFRQTLSVSSVTTLLSMTAKSIFSATSFFWTDLYLQNTLIKQQHNINESITINPLSRQDGLLKTLNSLKSKNASFTSTTLQFLVW